MSKNKFPTEAKTLMKVPPGSGSFSIRGFELLPDNGIVELPNDMVEEAKSHGLKVATEEDLAAHDKPAKK